MPRPPRIQVAGATYHVTSRGNRQQPIFFDANDRTFFNRWLGNVVAEAEWQIFSYVQMTNHFHFVVRTPKANLSRGMQRLKGVYGQFLNDRHELGGHAFQGRYDAQLIDSDAHLLECVRYDDLNPVRAKMVDHPAQWRWGSYRAAVGLDPEPGFLRIDLLLALFAPDVERARVRYRAFIEDGLARLKAAARSDSGGGRRV